MIGVDRRNSVLELQEVDSRAGPHAESMQLDYLARATGMDAFAESTILRHDGDYGNALLTRRPVLAVRRHDISFASREPRGALDADLDVDGHRVRVIATHLGLRPVERRYQVKLPDIYQGSEIWDFSLVDPDNRRPVDYAARQAALRAVKTLFAERGRPPACSVCSKPCRTDASSST